MPCHEVPVFVPESPYKVLVGAGLLARTGELACGVLDPCRCAVVTDTNVAPLFASVVEESLTGAGFDPFRIVVPAGETSKSLTRAQEICSAMLDAGLDRSSVLFALGGGVVGDLAGFCAAIFQRGIPYIQIPTTIVAQVDSSVGGKTGVNLPAGKNLVGSFHQPRLVIADTEALKTLPRREFNEGFAEVIKHSAIRDPEMLSLLSDITDLPRLVARNVQIKASIVAEDQFETSGLRALLNFGHTIGHGIEAAAGYGALLHGEAISLGLVAACHLSVQKAGLPAEDSQLILDALRAFNLPLVLPADIATHDILDAMKADKKFASGAVRFVLLRKLGDAFVSKDVSWDEIAQAIERLRLP